MFRATSDVVVYCTISLISGMFIAHPIQSCFIIFPHEQSRYRFMYPMIIIVLGYSCIYIYVYLISHVVYWLTDLANPLIFGMPNMPTSAKDKVSKKAPMKAPMKSMKKKASHTCRGTYETMTETQKRMRKAINQYVTDLFKTGVSVRVEMVLDTGDHEVLIRMSSSGSDERAETIGSNP